MVNLPNGKCPICGASAFRGSDNGIYMIVECEICGYYWYSASACTVYQGNTRLLSPKVKACMYYYLTQIRNPDSRIIPHFHNDSSYPMDEIREDQHQMISLASLQNMYPQTLDDMLSMILVNLAKICGYMGNEITLISNEQNAHLYFIEQYKEKAESVQQQIEYLWDVLIQNELMSARGKHTQGSYFFCSLTPRGWNRVAEYQKHQKQSQKAFVAMWFDNSMNNAREQIIQAVESCGYFASIIDLKEHNNQIVPEIFYEIRHSRFVIADLTGQRGGVYYEAGYAAGLEIPVILCCRASDQTNVHFDVRQKNTIFWDDEHELRDRLIKRIHATVG